MPVLLLARVLLLLLDMLSMVGLGVLLLDLDLDALLVGSVGLKVVSPRRVVLKRLGRGCLRMAVGPMVCRHLVGRVSVGPIVVGGRILVVGSMPLKVGLMRQSGRVVMGGRVVFSFQRRPEEP